MIRCIKCLTPKDDDEFSWKQKGIRRSNTCRKCHAEYRERHYQKNKQKYVDRAKASNKKYAKRFKEFICQYLSTHPCVDCGETDIRMLDFDHVRGKKHMHVTRMVTYSLATVQKEIDKCDVRCANCHRKRTSENLDDNRNQFNTR